MKSDFFIDRPIFSIVISIVIVIVGVLGLFLLPIDQYPQIVPPVVKVSASFRELAHRRSPKLSPLPSSRN